MAEDPAEARAVRRVLRILRQDKEEGAPWHVSAKMLEGALWDAVPRRIMATFFPRRWCAGGAGGMEQYQAFLTRCYVALVRSTSLKENWRERIRIKHLHGVGWDGERIGWRTAEDDASPHAPALPCAAYLALFRRFSGGTVTLPRLLNLLTEHVMPGVLPDYRLTPGVRLHLLLTPVDRSPHDFRFPCRWPHHGLPVRVEDMHRWGSLVRRAVTRHFAAADPLMDNAQKRRLLWRARRGVRGFGGGPGEWNVHTQRVWTAHRTWDLVTHDETTERRVHQKRAALALGLFRNEASPAPRRRPAPGRVPCICDIIPMHVLEHVVRTYV